MLKIQHNLSVCELYPGKFRLSVCFALCSLHDLQLKYKISAWKTCQYAVSDMPQSDKKFRHGPKIVTEWENLKMLLKEEH